VRLPKAVSFGSACLPVRGHANQNRVCSTMATQLQRFLTNAGIRLSGPWVVIAVLLYTAFWLIFDSRSFGWHGVTTIATLLMTSFIQRSEHRDTQGTHAKLDEMLRVNGDAENQLTKLDDREPEQVEEFRDRARGKMNRNRDREPQGRG